MKNFYLIIIIIIAICFVSACANFDDGLCSNQEMNSLLSPNGKNKVVIFARDCGATTAISIQIAILAASDKLPNKGGNTFAATIDNATTSSEIESRSAVNIVWENDKEVVVIYNKQAEVFLSEQSVNGIHIRYEPK